MKIIQPVEIFMDMGTAMKLAEILVPQAFAYYKIRKVM
jgi:hypothetical protein